ncbi:hypothetical protein FKR81_11520 [Lentzea tibetensis]|uniref:Uncharacterized protein n=1 Tax=Lentzea tibetensis TaxID=2591470 RepID=A0A563EXC4_9PSEU|nr:hypothetical protein [Lentzea tibetensis]TWP52198.1 hypothetical protein FKR81_11520 [Lentzea tibetensis]
MNGTDPVSGRKYALARSSRGDGLYLADTSTSLRVAIEVPHPTTDLDTERIGLALWRKVPGAMLLVSGTHRRVADVAHEPDTVFHAMAVRLAEQDVPQLQIHGFHDGSLPDADVVVSPGSAATGPFVRSLAESLSSFEVCRGWQSECGKLEGTRNVQGRACAEAGSPFAHVELSRSVREDRQDEVVTALAAGL